MRCIGICLLVALSAVPATGAERFPALVLHVLQREYAQQHPAGQTRAAYVEQRLCQLYPEQARPGMLVAGMRELRRLGGAGIGDMPLVVLRPDECRLFSRLDALAACRMDRAGMDRLTAARHDRLLLPAAMAGIYAVWQIVLARERAIEMTARHYPGCSAGQPGDAFRHVYVSLLLRSRIGALGAAVVMNGYEAVTGNAPRDEVMDRHNNRIGRVRNFRELRGPLRQAIGDWQAWAARVSSWIDDPAHGVLLDGWHTQDPSWQTAWADARTVTPTRYIYYCSAN